MIIYRESKVKGRGNVAGGGESIAEPDMIDRGKIAGIPVLVLSLDPEIDIFVDLRARGEIQKRETVGVCMGDPVKR